MQQLLQWREEIEILQVTFRFTSGHFVNKSIIIDYSTVEIGGPEQIIVDLPVATPRSSPMSLEITF